jgi:hypothetical protein
MRSHFSLNQGVAAACAFAGAAAMLNGNCCAQTFIAADYATNATYAADWSAGQNGGYGFGPWSMNGTEATSPNEHAMDRTSSYDPFGVAWALFNPEGSAPSSGFPDNSPGTCANPPTGTDISRAGRALPNGGLQPGQRFSTVIANPTDRRFYRGYTIVLSTGSDNIAYDKQGSQVEVGTFEYFTYGKWYTPQSYPTGGTSLFDTDTSTNGMQLDVTMTSTNAYQLVMMPLGHPELAWSEHGTLKTNGPINWVTYQLYNTDSNFYPPGCPCGPDRTDFYIKSMTVSWLALNVQRAGSDIILSWLTNSAGFSLFSSTNLGPTAAWHPVSPSPSVLNDQNVVTNPIAAKSQFYRLQQ